MPPLAGAARQVRQRGVVHAASTHLDHARDHAPALIFQFLNCSLSGRVLEALVKPSLSAESDTSVFLSLFQRSQMWLRSLTSGRRFYSLVVMALATISCAMASRNLDTHVEAPPDFTKKSAGKVRRLHLQDKP